MAVSVRTIQTAVPATVLTQHLVRDVFAAQEGLTRLGRRLVTASFDGSAIETRYSVIDELTLDRQFDDPQFFDLASGALLAPSTRVRNELYIERASLLYIEAARKALDAVPGLTAADITHVVTVSCTGFFAPGPDYVLVRELGLAPSTLRYHVGFMGCYAAFPALRMAKSFCEADPDAVVLVVSAELCTLHVRSSNEPDQIVASSVFADGAAAAIVTARDMPAGPEDGFVLDLDFFESVLTPVGEQDMAWKIGDEGFEMILSSYVPKIIDEHITGALEPLLARDASLGAEASTEIAHWAVHPGGRSILDKVESKLGLSEQQMTASREILRDYGNMSSATILFVLKAILESATPPSGGDRVCAMAFGPGLTVETGLMTVRSVPAESSIEVPVERPASSVAAREPETATPRVLAEVSEA
ncbi:type III polyketide synthase [Herbiconiux ginsengi]|uniref:Predicted naringenin-chalcone synthase n=1 Tax=Herbiconiux ginsengi TaxID=381665 RepID=A0A1H3PIQ1_9MICO|nr:type III polyketide synthase [Herbiconiux ginsengi]SDZ00996.1 Predicted naringenin-chalcone synthase [Herbiconiux ginsengi]